MVTLVKRDSEIVEGDYRGVRIRSSDFYAGAYNLTLYVSGYEGYVPRLGELVTILTPRSCSKGLYLGIDRNQVLIQEGQEKDTLGISLDSVVTVNGVREGAIRGTDLRRLVHGGEVLSRSCVIVRADGRNVIIPYEAVDRISVGVTKHGPLTGFLIGLGFDAAAATCVYIGVKSGGGSSCGASGISIGEG
jgi:hypothetical protein